MDQEIVNDIFLAQQEFNKYYNDVYNCKIVAPPYYPWNVPHLFFFDKRDGFSRFESGIIGSILNTYDYVFDYERFEVGTNIIYWILAKQSTSVKLIRISYNWTTVSSSVEQTMTYVEWVNYKFFYMPHVRWEVSTIANGSSTSDILTWDTASWRVRIKHESNASWWTGSWYEWMYVYCYDWQASTSAWVWQVLYVDYKVDAQYLDVTSAWWKVSPTKLRYKMFADWGTVLAFVWSDFVYTIPTYDIYSPTSWHIVLAAANIQNPVDVLYANNRVFAIQRNLTNTLSNNILWGGEGFFSLYYWGTSLIWSIPSAYNITQFQNYILIMSWNAIDTIAQITTKINNIDVTMDIIVNVTRDVTLMWQNAFKTYNEGLYIFTKNKKFFAVTILSQNIYRYQVTLQNQWIYMQKHFDTFNDNDKINVVVENTDIYIIRTTDVWTDVYIYDSFFKWWHRWHTELFISWLKQNIFYWDNLYTTVSGSVIDEPDGINKTYTQSVQCVIGEQTLFAVKNLAYTKFVIGNRTDKEAYVVWDTYSWWDNVQYTLGLEKSRYFTKISSATSSGMMGTALLGTWIYMIWGEASSKVSPIANLEVACNFPYEVWLITVIAKDEFKFVLGWIVTWYASYNIAFTPQSNSF